MVWCESTRLVVLSNWCFNQKHQGGRSKRLWVFFMSQKKKKKCFHDLLSFLSNLQNSRQKRLVLTLGAAKPGNKKKKNSRRQKLGGKTHIFTKAPAASRRRLSLSCSHTRKQTAANAHTPRNKGAILLRKGQQFSSSDRGLFLVRSCCPISGHPPLAPLAPLWPPPPLKSPPPPPWRQAPHCSCTTNKWQFPCLDKL